MSSTVELPFWPIVSAVYRGVGGTIKTNGKYIAFSHVILTVIVFFNNLINWFLLKPIINQGDPFHFAMSYNALTNIGSFFLIYYFQWSIYIVCIRSCLNGSIASDLFSAFFNRRAARLFGYEIIIYLAPCLIAGLGIGAVFITVRFEFIWAAFVFGFATFLAFFYIFVLLMRLAIFPAYIAVDQFSYKNLSSIMKKMKWRFWKTISLMFASCFPVLIIESVIGFSSWKFKNPDIAHIENPRLFFAYFDAFDLFLPAFNYAFYIVAASVLLSQMIAEIFSRIERFDASS